MTERKLGGLFKNINDEIAKRANNEFRKSNLTSVQVSALFFLTESSKGYMTMKEMESMLRVSQPTVTGIINRLESKGFIESFGNDEDRRIKMIRITQKGKECIKEAETGRDEIEKAIRSDLSDEEADHLYSLLEKVMKSL